MKTIDTGKYGPSYRDLVDSFGVDVLAENYDDDYQGDARYLLRDGARYGLLFFGWGSCSGCDALQACDTPVEITELRDQLWNEVRWESSAPALLSYITAKDWELDYAYRADETKQFLSQATDLLRNCEESQS